VSIHGTIEEAALPDVLQLLALGGKTGCLSVSDGPAERRGTQGRVRPLLQRLSAVGP